MLIKQLRAAFTPNCNIYNSIAIVIILNSIYKDFNNEILILVKTSNKTIDKIQQILYSGKAKNPGK